ncbi:MAG TPA: T9SS type A sorting domain-containing protein [Rubricoccaceae bacterium]|nr:T9SS type A sorting domain-containing protein [Rubricoccaceae bacterium]
METATPRALRRDSTIVLGLLLGLPLFLAACEIIEVLQPSSAFTGDVIEVTVTVEQPFEDINPHRGVLSVLVPDDWSFVSGTYGGDAGTGDMLEDEGWADSTEIVLPAPPGMKWIGTISDEAHAVTSAPAFFDATLSFQIGQTEGDFGIGYFTTNDGFATADIIFGDSEDNTADTLMNVPITIIKPLATEDDVAAGAFTLAQNVPNPFAGSTTVGYTLTRAADVRVAVYDALGREVAVLAEGRRAPGEHAVTLDARGLSAGTYLYRLTVDGEVVATRRMTLAR